MNNWVGIGRLTKDPEIRYTAGEGIAIANFTIAVDRNYKNAQGEREADFIPVVCFRKLAELVANNLTKGRLVAVSGAIQTSSYTAQDGTKRYKTEVVADEVKFLDRPKPTTNRQQTDNDGFIPIEGEELPPWEENQF
ncbi:Single-stranded DNA-binding protein SsbB [Caloramator mitchellensis]|uniref:Single-stranded DNA-binding protein n=1 Tax=Caloramator mitchellensis TaxID=908809 RepID=A0A0R3JXV0_CALMK|nr:single-stranded DNA-binding protein [Caloramator mitchellensis]KRQ86030.1 Single-stranded DNA-binding protein SsbB [Caloramator mitchellensis]